MLHRIIDLAERTGRRLMAHPVFTRKVHTSIFRLACIRKLLEAWDVVFP